MKPNHTRTLASEDDSRDELILRRHGSHADDGDSAPRERTALARTRLREGDDDEDPHRAARQGRGDARRPAPRR